MCPSSQSTTSIDLVSHASPIVWAWNFVLGQLGHLGVSRGASKHPLCCPCGGRVLLGGSPAPTYTCDGCHTERHSLAELVIHTPRAA
jgi:hypothetical protein